MKTLAILGAVSALTLAMPAYAQAPQPTSPGAMQAPNAQTPNARGPSAQPAETIKNVVVIDRDNLPPTAQTQVDALIAETDAEHLQSLRKSIDSIPRASSALQAKGLTSSQVVAANYAQDGTLTLIVKQAS